MFRNLLLLSFCFAFALSVPIDNDANQEEMAKTIQKLLENERLTKEERKNLLAKEIFESFEKKKNVIESNDSSASFSAEEKELIQKNHDIIFDPNENEESITTESSQKEVNTNDSEWTEYLAKKIQTKVNYQTEASVKEEKKTKKFNYGLVKTNPDVVKRSLRELSSVYRYFDNLIQSKPFKMLHKFLTNPVVTDVKVSLIRLVRSENAKRMREKMIKTPIVKTIDTAMHDVKAFFVELKHDTNQILKSIFL